jgi:hypothetical protein
LEKGQTCNMPTPYDTYGAAEMLMNALEKTEELD